MLLSKCSKNVQMFTNKNGQFKGPLMKHKCAKIHKNDLVTLTLDLNNNKDYMYVEPHEECLQKDYILHQTANLKINSKEM